MLGVDGGFACRTKRDLVTRHVIQNVEHGQSSISKHRNADLLRCLWLEAGRLQSHQLRGTLGLEDAGRDLQTN